MRTGIIISIFLKHLGQFNVLVDNLRLQTFPHKNSRSSVMEIPPNKCPSSRSIIYI